SRDWSSDVCSSALMTCLDENWIGPACEWNPEKNVPAMIDDEFHAVAELSLGSNGQWHVCRHCAQLPRFKRFRRRIWLARAMLQCIQFLTNGKRCRNKA